MWKEWLKMTPEIKARLWIEINTEAVLNNFKILQDVFKDVKILAVIKADAYGFGLIEMARIFSQAGAYMLGVTSIYEGLELRRNGIETPILIMAPLLSHELYSALENNLTVTAGSKEDIIKLNEAAGKRREKANFHLKIDTGLSRNGVLPQDIPAIVDVLHNEKFVEMEGVFTHFAEASQEKRTAEQFVRFQNAAAYLKKEGFNVLLRHCCNSSAAVKYPEMRLDMVRLGTILYGQHPQGMRQNYIQLENPWQVKTLIKNIKKVSKGTSIGYGGDYIARRDSKIAVIPVGYADGFTVASVMKAKNISDLFMMIIKTILAYIKPNFHINTYNKVKGKKVPLVGRVGMQLSILDITNIEEVEVGDEVSIFLRRVTASAAVPRVYLYGKKIYKIDYRQI